MTKEQFMGSLTIQEYNEYIEMEEEDQNFLVLMANHMRIYKEKTNNADFTMERYVSVMKSEGLWQ